MPRAVIAGIRVQRSRSTTTARLSSPVRARTRRRTNDLAVWRYNADGTLDSSFNPSGTIPGVFTHHNAAGGDNGDLGNSIAIDALGNLVVTGTSINFVGTAIITTRMVLWRIAP